MSYKTEPQTKIEYSIVGNDIDEQFNNKQDAQELFDSLSEEELKGCQFFSKEWEFDEDSNRWMEGNVEIFFNSPDQH